MQGNQPRIAKLKINEFSLENRFRSFSMQICVNDSVMIRYYYSLWYLSILPSGASFVCLTFTMLLLYKFHEKLLLHLTESPTCPFVRSCNF